MPNKSSNLSFIVLCLTLILAIIIVISTAVVLTQSFDLRDSRREYASLQEIADFIGIEFNGLEYGTALEIAFIETENEPAPYVSVLDEEMRQINAEYVCWLKIDGTKVDYPVVRADDNEKYLNLSFYGEENRYGAIFMDYRNKGDYVPHIIIYGHNTKTGDVFGSLRNFLDKKYRAEHPVITLKVNDRMVEYEIFAAKKTDINDPAYFLDFNTPGSFDAFLKRINAPEDAAQIITLSTCVSAGNDAERMIVQGVYK